MRWKVMIEKKIKYYKLLTKTLTHLKTGDMNYFLIKFIKQVENVKKLITIEKLEINYPL